MAKLTKVQIVRRVAKQALRVPRRDRAMFIREQSLILGAIWDKDQDKLQEYIHAQVRDIAFSLRDLPEKKDYSRRYSVDAPNIDSEGNYTRHCGVDIPEKNKRREKSGLTAQERRDAHQIFVVMSVHDDEICEEYQTQDEADIAASRFTKAVVIRRYSRKNGLEAEDWTYSPDNWKWFW